MRISTEILKIGQRKVSDRDDGGDHPSIQPDIVINEDSTRSSRKKSPFKR